MNILNEAIGLGIYLVIFAVSVLAITVFRPRALWFLTSVLNFANPAPVAPIPLVPAQVLSFGAILKFGKSSLRIFRFFVPWALILLSVVYAVNIPRSINGGSGLYSIITLMAILFMIALGFVAHEHSTATNKPSLLYGTMVALAPLTIAQAVATIIFRVSPELENRYLRSDIFILLLGDEARFLFTDRPNNVLDPLKAGGLFYVNGNRASMVMAVIALLYFAVWFERRGFVIFLLGALSMTGALFTNSKTATILTVVIPALFLILPSTVRAGKNQGAALLGSLTLVGLGAVFWQLAARLPEFIAGVDEATGSRSMLFSAAVRYFQEAPFSGLGFGGWAEHWAADAVSYNLPPRLPPHNFIIMEWANAGLLAVALMILILINMGINLIRKIREAETDRIARAWSFRFAALAWMVAHGMYDNTTFYGTSNTLFIFAFLVAELIYQRSQRIPDDSTHDPALVDPLVEADSAANQPIAG